MDKLLQARETIDRIDQEMAKLFCERMNAVTEVAAYKKERGLAIFDATREEAVINKNTARIENEALRSYYTLFLKNTMALSRQYQYNLMEGARVAYSGVEGAFAHIAATRIFKNGITVSHSDFEAAYLAVVNGECDYAVLPIENSYAGEVGQVMDLMFAGNLFINGIYDLRITQNLVGLSGATPEDITTVISHPQAINQCQSYIQKHGYNIEQAVNTARAAQEIVKRNDKSIAAIASAESAALYGLTLLDHDINESAVNTTRFAVFSRVENASTIAPQNTFLLFFTVSNTAGSLAKAISVIGKYGFNMKVLRSRPVKERAWEYYFYVEAEGDERSDQGKEMLCELKQYCDKLKVVGRYAIEINLEESETLV